MTAEGKKSTELEKVYVEAKALAESIQAVAVYQASQLTPPQFNIPRTAASKLADLVAKLASGQNLIAPDSSTFYTPGEKGYTDYPNYKAS